MWCCGNGTSGTLVVVGTLMVAGMLTASQLDDNLSSDDNALDNALIDDDSDPLTRVRLDSSSRTRA